MVDLACPKSGDQIFMLDWGAQLSDARKLLKAGDRKLPEGTTLSGRTRPPCCPTQGVGRAGHPVGSGVPRSQREIAQQRCMVFHAKNPARVETDVPYVPRVRLAKNSCPTILHTRAAGVGAMLSQHATPGNSCRVTRLLIKLRPVHNIFRRRVTKVLIS